VTGALLDGVPFKSAITVDIKNTSARLLASAFQKSYPHPAGKFTLRPASSRRNFSPGNELSAKNRDLRL
jgi:hypothetical protein